MQTNQSRRATEQLGDAIAAAYETAGLDSHGTTWAPTSLAVAR
jgi:hypothetical protein